MGQEISHSNTLCGHVSNNNKRHSNKKSNNNSSNFLNKNHQNYSVTTTNCNKYTKHKPHQQQQSNLSFAPISSSSASSVSSTDDEHYRQRQKYNLHKQAFEKTKISKKFSISSNDSSFTSSTSNSKATSSTSTTKVKTNSSDLITPTNDYNNLKNSPGYSQPSKFVFGNAKGRLIQSPQQRFHQRKNPRSNDSGIYYSSTASGASSSSCYCSSGSLCSTSTASTKSGSSTSPLYGRSSKTIDNQKNYLNHHLYIKSYLDILEEDEKARANYTPGKPGGIRNYTPKILAEASSNSCSTTTSAAVLASKFDKLRADNSENKDDPWI